jgi:hypothetical protein
VSTDCLGELLKFGKETVSCLGFRAPIEIVWDNSLGVSRTNCELFGFQSVYRNCLGELLKFGKETVSCSGFRVPIGIVWENSLRVSGTNCELFGF